MKTDTLVKKILFLEFIRTPSKIFSWIFWNHLPFANHSPVNPAKDWRQNESLSVFSPATSTNVKISHQNILTFSFNPFPTLVKNFKATSSASSKLLNLNQEHTLKKLVFQVKILWSWGYDNFCHKNVRVTKLWWHDHIYNKIWLMW